jgi:hypothetical protein
VVDNTRDTSSIAAEGVVNGWSAWVGIIGVALRGDAAWVGAAAVLAASGGDQSAVGGWWCNAGTLFDRGKSGGDAEEERDDCDGGELHIVDKKLKDG